MDSKPINVRELLLQSPSAPLRLLARTPTQALERYVCEAEANDILVRLDGLGVVDFLNAVIRELRIELRVSGAELLPDDGRCVFVANHPFGVIDGIVLTSIVANRYGQFRAIANEAFLLIDALRESVVIANVYGRTARDGAARILDLYRSDLPITNFPAGEVSRLRGFRVSDREWQKSFVRHAIATRRDVVPIRFTGRNSGLFYAVNMLRRVLGIGVNIELTMLPREIFAKRGAAIEVRIGAPIAWRSLRDMGDHAVAAKAVRDIVYGLA